MDLSQFKWLNENKLTVNKDTGEFIIYAPAKTDFFNNPIPENGAFDRPIGNAPFLYTEIEGDFVIQVQVTPTFISNYDAACIMVMENENIWLKAAFEKSDFDTNAVVSVVTNEISDDANGCNIEADSIWLQVARIGNNFAIHYSLDGEKYDMVRLFFLPFGKLAKVGFLAQSPTGNGCEHKFNNAKIEKRTIKNPRAGI